MNKSNLSVYIGYISRLSIVVPLPGVPVITA